MMNRIFPLLLAACLVTGFTSCSEKKKSDVIREAIIFYSQNIEQNKKSRILKAIEKTKDIDKKDFENFEGTINDGI